MLNSSKIILNNNLNKHLIRDSDLAYLFAGTSARRHAITNKALKKGELIQICRGFYTFNDEYNPTKLSTFYLANRIVPFSFISA